MHSTDLHKNLREAAQAVVDEWNEPNAEPPSETHFHDLVMALESALAAEEARAEARTHVPPAGGMTRDEIEDVYRDDPGKLYSMLEQLD